MGTRIAAQRGGRSAGVCPLPSPTRRKGLTRPATSSTWWSTPKHARAVLILTLAAVRTLAPDKYRVLLTKVPPPPEPEGPQLRHELQRQGIPVFAAEIPRLKSFEKAATEGVPVYAVLHDKRANRAWEAYASAGKAIMHGG